MTGSEPYKEFDNASIITASTSKETNISFGRYRFRKRDLLFGGIAIVALILVIILAIVLATKASDSNSSDCKDGGSPGGKTDDDKLPYCVSLECLKAAVYQKPIIDEKVNPCDDFYNFACGQYAKHHPQSQFIVDVTPESEIVFENTRNLVYLLNSAVEDKAEHSYEKKLKEFLSSCDNHFDKMDLRGRPMIEKMIRPLGGWYVFDTFDESQFDLQTLLKKVHVDFWTPAFFDLSLQTHDKNWNKKIVELTFGGLRMNYRYYQTNIFTERIQEIYKQYIKVIATHLSADAGIPPNTLRIDQFIDDVFQVESAIAAILLNVSFTPDRHAPDSLLTLGQMNTHLKSTIDFVDYMKTLFNEWPGKFSANTNVAITLTGYFDQLGNLISTYLQTPDGKRILHNYLMWQAIDSYSHDLSWTYIHAKRKLNQLIYNFKDESSGYAYCFGVAEAAFTQAINAIYVKKHFGDKSRNEARAILDGIKDILVEDIANLNWMTEGERATATKKIKDSLYKIGFPDNVVDEEYLDSFYYPVKVAKNDYFGNVVNLNSIYRRRLNYNLGKPDSKTAWVYNVYDPIVEYFNPWSELIITSAMLQNPLFDHNGPAYYNYGGIGSRIASNLIHAVDEYGSSFKLDGSHLGVWWSNATIDHYTEIKKCAIKSQENEVIGPFTDSFGFTTNINTSFYSPGWAPELLADTSGVRKAHEAYRRMLRNKNQIEKLPPGFHNFNVDQMFFISYAQSYCRNSPDYIKQYYLRTRGEFPNENRVNLAMQNIPEFKTAFNCPSRPSDRQRCLLFGK